MPDSPVRLSASSALQLLELFADHKTELHEDTFDVLFDTVLDVLDRCNDEKHRLVKKDR